MLPSLPLWRYAIKSHAPDEERAYREHYLDSDIKHLSISIYAMTAIQIALIVLDLTLIGDQPELLAGLIVKITFLFMTLAMLYTVNKMRLASVLDVSVIVYCAIFAGGVILSHVLNDYTPARMTIIVTLCIFTAHIAFPVYASYLSLCMAIFIVGESAILFTTVRPELLAERSLMMITFLFALAISVLASALHQRSRYESFKALQEVNTLSGFLPICANCKQIRDDSGYYQQIEQFIAARSDVVFNHGICPPCKEELYGDLLTNIDKKEEEDADVA